MFLKSLYISTVSLKFLVTTCPFDVTANAKLKAASKPSSYVSGLSLFNSGNKAGVLPTSLDNKSLANFKVLSYQPSALLLLLKATSPSAHISFIKKSSFSLGSIYMLPLAA